MTLLTILNTNAIFKLICRMTPYDRILNIVTSYDDQCNTCLPLRLYSHSIVLKKKPRHYLHRFIAHVYNCNTFYRDYAQRYLKREVMYETIRWEAIGDNIMKSHTVTQTKN